MILTLAGLLSGRKIKIRPANREDLLAIAIIAPFVFLFAVGCIKSGVWREAWEWLYANVFF